MDWGAAERILGGIPRLSWASQMHAGNAPLNPNSLHLFMVTWETGHLISPGLLCSLPSYIRVWRKWSASLVSTLRWSQNGRLAFLFRSSSATFLLCFKTGVPRTWAVMQFVRQPIVFSHQQRKYGYEPLLRGTSFLVCPFRTRSCCLHLKSATKSWCSAITSPSIGRPLTTTCWSTSSTFVPTKCLKSQSAYICLSPGYWQVG